MTVVLVHGNPETEAIWSPLADTLGRDDVVRLSPPGFGAPLPDAFPATYLAYRDWLEAELEGFDEPVDVVGHDWGGGHVVNVVMHRPELVRSWASDVVRARTCRRSDRSAQGDAGTAVAERPPARPRSVSLRTPAEAARGAEAKFADKLAGIPRG